MSKHLFKDRFCSNFLLYESLIYMFLLFVVIIVMSENDLCHVCRLFDTFEEV